jgi:hypothetical protein
MDAMNRRQRMRRVCDWLLTSSGFLVAALLLVLLPWSVRAQQSSPMVPTSLEILIIAPTGDPNTLPAIAMRSTPISAGLNCNLAASPAAGLPLINPTAGEVTDPFTPGRVCRVPLPPSVPNGSNYRAVATFSGLCDGGPCTTARSAVGVPPFNLAGPQVPGAAPTSLGLRP